MTKLNLTFEQAVAKLEQIVQQIEEGKVSLEESIQRYAEGIDLYKHCRAKLDQMEKTIQVLAKGEGDNLEVSGQLPEEPSNPLQEGNPQ
jgi:exodeoxyribonuclease VII small subunit